MATISDAQLKRALQNVVKDAKTNKEDITVKRARARVETLLDLEEGFFGNDETWRARSKEIIKSAFDEEEGENKQSERRSAVEGTPKAKPVETAKAQKRTEGAEKKVQPQKSEQKENVAPRPPQQRSQKNAAKTTQPVVPSGKVTQPGLAEPTERNAIDGTNKSEEESGNEGEGESKSSEKASLSQPTPTPKRPNKTVPTVNGVKRQAAQQLSSADSQKADHEQPRIKKARTDSASEQKDQTAADDDDDASSQSESEDSKTHQENDRNTVTPEAAVHQSKEGSRLEDSENEGEEEENEDDVNSQSKSDESEDQEADQQAQVAPKTSVAQPATGLKREVLKTKDGSDGSDGDSDDDESTSDEDSQNDIRKRTSAGSRSASPDVPNGSKSIPGQNAASEEDRAVSSEDDEDDEDGDADEDGEDENGDEGPSATKAIEDKGKRKDETSSTPTSLQPILAGLAAVAPKPFKPPAGYNALDPAQLQDNEAFTSANLDGKQIWHITAPSDLTLSTISEVAFDAIQSGQAILTHKNTEYILNEAQTNLNNRAALLVPTTSGYQRVEQPIERSLQIQSKFTRPNLSIRQASQATGSAAAADVAEPAVATVRPQPKGLRMRYKPPGFGAGKPGMIGSESDSEEDGAGEQPPLRATFQFPRSLGAHGTLVEQAAGGAETNADAEAAVKKPKKKRKEAHATDSPIRLLNGVSASPESNVMSPVLDNGTTASTLLTNGVGLGGPSDVDKAKRKEEKRLKKGKKEANRRSQTAAN